MTEAGSGADLLNNLAHEFAERYRLGERPALTEYTDKYPELAADIRELFPAMVVMEQFGQPTGAEAKGVAADGPMPQQMGEYRILREVARGGMGIVYEAVQEPLGRHVALKVLPFQSLATGNHLERFQREARAAANLHHTNIVPVFGVGEHQGVHYYAMQFIQGHSLDSVLRELRHLRQVKRNGSDHSPLCISPQGRGETQRGAVGEDYQEGDLSFSLAAGLLSGRFEANQESAENKDERGTANLPLPLGENRRLRAGVRGSGSCQSRPLTPVPSPPRGEGSSESSLTLCHSSLSSQTEQQYFRSVARLGVQVAEALAYAHGQGVLHRDIKPSNLLLDTQGTVWVTDFGLAKAVDSEDLTATGDIIGTLRYMAPERFQGQADVRGDVYGLGVTLYEMLTLRPVFVDTIRARLVERILREEAPRPRKLDSRIPRDLETVVLKAIAKEPEKRYRSAEAFAEDLRRFLADRPVHARRVSVMERTWRWCNRNPAVASLLMAVGLLLGAVAGVSMYAAIRTDQALQKKAEAERQARLREADALVGQAHGIRLSRRAGQRFDALEALGKAAAIGRELEKPPTWFDRLRNEAIAALALPDLHIAQEWEEDSETTWVEMSDDFSLYVRANEKGECTIHRLADHAEIARLPEWGESVEAVFGTGRTLGIRGASGRFELWDLASQEPRLRFKDSGIADDNWAWSFRADGRLIALSHADGSISVRDTATGERVYQLAPGRVIKGKPVLHPSEPFVAIFNYDNRQFQVADLRTGAVITEAPTPWSMGNGLGAWSPDGRTLTVPSGDNDKIQQYAFDPAAPALRPTRVRENTATGCPAIVYNRAGDRFVSRGWNTKVALFDAVSGRVLFTTPEFPVASGARLRFDSTGKRLAGARPGNRKEKVGLWSVADAREYRALVRASSNDAYYKLLIAIHPAGRFSAIGSIDGVAIFDLEGGRELALLPVIRDVSAARLKALSGSVETASVAFDGAGNLVTNSFAGTFRWPVRTAPPVANVPGLDGRIVIGPAERLALKPGQNAIAASRDGQVIAQCMWTGYGEQAYAGGWILHPNSREPLQVDPGTSMGSCSVTPDRRWVAFGGEAVKVYEAATRKCVFQSPPNHGNYARFTPDGRWLVTEVDGGQVYAVDTWEPGAPLGPGRPWDATNDMAVMAQPNGIYRLVELATGRELARLEDPDQVTGPAVFTPDGSKLVVTAKDGLRVWDLRRIREELAKLGLDWDGPPAGGKAEQPENPGSQAGKPDLRVELELGDLVAREKYSLILVFFPLHADAYYQRGLAYSRFEQWNEARSDFSMTLALKPDQAAAHYHRGLIYAREGRQPEALADFTRAIELQPTYGEAYLARAQAHLNLQHWPEAVTDLSKYLELAPDEPRARHLRATAYTRLRNWDQALADLDRAIELDAGYVQAWTDRGFAHVREGQWEKAASDFARMMELNPNDHWSWYRGAPLFLHIGDTKGYRRICREMLKHFGNTDNPNIAERVAKTCTLVPDAVSDLGPVLKLAERAVTGTEKHPSYRWFVLFKGLAEYRAGHYAGAVEWLNRFSPQVDGVHWDATAFAVLAMAQHRLGVAGAESSKPRLGGEAREALNHAQAILSQKMPDPKAGRPFGTDWPYTVDAFHDWLHARILCREAEALLGTKEEKTHHQDTKDAKQKR